MTLRAELIRYSHRLADQGFVAAYDGNLSARLRNDSILITASGLNKGEIDWNTVVEVSASGKASASAAKPSAEVLMHLAIYRSRPDVHAVVHAHPPYATAFAAAGIELPANVLPEVIVGLGKISLAPYATPSTDEVGKSLEPFTGECDAVLLANHGAVTCGSSIRDAYFKMEKLEHYARIIFLARQLGGEKRLNADQLKLLAAVSEKSYGKKLKIEP
jgi:L-fuculose-phosphate aldolase